MAATPSDPSRISDILPTPTNPATNKGTLVTSTVDGRTSIIGPFIGDVTGTSSAEAGVLEQQQVVMSGIDAVMSLTVSEQDAIDLLSCFSITEQNTPYTAGGTAALDYPNGNKLPLLEVGFDGKEDQFAAVLRKIVRTASETAPNTHENIVTYFNEEMRRMLNAHLANSGLIDMLEASNVDKVRVVLDVSGGVDDLEAKMEDPTAATRRRLFATQVPIANYKAYGFPEGTLTMNFLPLVAGDFITFVFDIEVSPPSSLTGTGSQIESDTNGGMITLQTSGAYATTLNTFMYTTKRRVAFKVKLHDGGKAFAKKYDEELIELAVNTDDCINDASASTFAIAARDASVFSLQTDASMNAYPNPGAAPTIDMGDTKVPYGYGGESTAVEDASGYVWNVYIPAWDVSNNEPPADISGAANEYMASVWALNDGASVSNAKRTADIKVTSLAAIVADLSGQVVAADAAVTVAVTALQDASSAYFSGLETLVTQEVIDTAIADAQADISAALIVLTDASNNYADALWMKYYATDDAAGDAYISPNHPEPPKTTLVLQEALADAQAALQEAIDASGENYDPALLSAFNAAAEALSAKQAAVALVGLYTTLYDSAEEAKDKALKALSDAQEALGVAELMELGSIADVSSAYWAAVAEVETARAALANITSDLGVASGLLTTEEGIQAAAEEAYNTAYDLARSAKYDEFKEEYDAWVSSRKQAATDAYGTALALYTIYYEALAGANSVLRSLLKTWAVKKAVYDEYQKFAGREVVALA